LDFAPMMALPRAAAGFGEVVDFGCSGHEAAMRRAFDGVFTLVLDGGKALRPPSTT